MLSHPAVKFVIAFLTAAFVALQGFMSDDKMTDAEYVLVVVAALGAATLWLAGNQYSHPLYKATKALVMVLTAGAAALMSYATVDGELADVDWWKVGALAVGAVLVYVAPPSPDNEPAPAPVG